MADILKRENFVLIDIEGIQISKNHICTRLIYMLSKDGLISKEIEFLPCEPLDKLDYKYQRAYEFCKWNIHGLEFDPSAPSLQCADAAREVQKFSEICNSTLIVYKGGIIEKRLCESINMRSLDIETLGAPRVNSHDPCTEVNTHYKWIQNNILS